MLVVVLVLLGVGALLGSFLLEWSRIRLGDGPARIEGTPASLAPVEVENRVRVEVLNAVGERGAAREAAMTLRRLGYDVVYFGNASSFGEEPTAVVDRSGREDAAWKVARSLGVDSVSRDLDPDLYLDATILLGPDWRERFRRLADGSEERARR